MAIETKQEPAYSLEGLTDPEFAVFCVENVAERLGANAENVYHALADESDILDSYIVPGYDILHTQSKEYIVDDIIGLMWERGVTV